MAGDDNDKTVFGQPLPTPPKPSGQGNAPGAAPQVPPVSPPPAAQPPAGGGHQSTVFGQPLPPAGGGPGQAPPPAAPIPTPAPGSAPYQHPQGGRVAPTAPQHPGYAPPPQHPGPINNPGAEDTWLGGALNPQPSAPPPPHQPQYQQPAYQQPPQQPQYQQPPPTYQQPQYQPQAGQQPAGSEIFPDIPQAEAPQAMMVTPRIALEDALKGTGLGAGGSTNPLIAASANLMILLGRLRTGLVEMQAGPLIDHVTREIDMFERNALEAGVSPQDAQDAKYALSATADDIVQNLPGADRGMWLQYSMVARFFGERSSGVGFFQKMDAAMKAPGQRFHLLELMLTCLSLGFEGQYRAMPNGGVELSRIRTAIYETLRRVQPRPDDDISVRWMPVLLGGKRRRGGTPIWVIGAMAMMMIVALFATLSTLLARQGSDVRGGILALHAGTADIAIERTEPVVQPYEAPDSGQLERIRAALATEIEAGQVEVEKNNDWVFVRVGQYLQFGSGSADLKSDFSTLAASISATLDKEFGPIRVVGHTDSDRMSGRGRYKTNEQLSVARATTVAEILKTSLTDASRITVEGKGAVEPIAENTSSEGKARNRRVEIMIPREE